MSKKPKDKKQAENQSPELAATDSDFSEQPKVKKSAKARWLAFWEWFKAAAWLQVLLIVGLVVGVVVSIPFIVNAITEAANNQTSKFYKNHRIDYSKLEGFLKGDDKGCNGLIGTDQQNRKEDEKFTYSETEEGFVVLLYKSNCDTCNSMQPVIETWYNNFNKEYANNGLKLYTIDVSWVYKKADKTIEKEGNKNDYDNKTISLEQQAILKDAVKQTYFDELDDVDTGEIYGAYKTVVSKELLNKTMINGNQSSTIPTPCFLTYTKQKSATNYLTSSEYETPVENAKPRQVIFGNIKDVSLTEIEGVQNQMCDCYWINKWKGKGGA